MKIEIGNLLSILSGFQLLLKACLSLDPEGVTRLLLENQLLFFFSCSNWFSVTHVCSLQINDQALEVKKSSIGTRSWEDITVVPRARFQPQERLSNLYARIYKLLSARPKKWIETKKRPGLWKTCFLLSRSYHGLVNCPASSSSRQWS